jgi:crotonobetainyl-CoA:carnitine CoA-transferase CaiB-like acyl-CoA transferase
MHLTGEPNRDPMLCGLPLIDLKAGDEAFAQVLLAMLEQKENGKGKRIDISMAQCATSWLITALPQTKFAENKSMIFTRSGNEHRSFVPSNCYPSKDGYVYLAIGSDIQWEKLTQIEGFQHCSKAERETNNGRKKDKESVYADIRKGLELYTTSEFIEICLMNGLAVAPVNDPKQVGEIDFIKKLMVKTILPNGKEVELFPAPMDTKFLKNNNNVMGLPPRLGEHNEKIFNEAGINTDQK